MLSESPNYEVKEKDTENSSWNHDEGQALVKLTHSGIQDCLTCNSF